MLCCISLTIFIEDNQSGADLTNVQKIVLYGSTWVSTIWIFFPIQYPCIFTVATFLASCKLWCVFLHNWINTHTHIEPVCHQDTHMDYGVDSCHTTRCGTLFFPRNMLHDTSPHQIPSGCPDERWTICVFVCVSVSIYKFPIYWKNEFLYYWLLPWVCWIFIFKNWK